MTRPTNIGPTRPLTTVSGLSGGSSGQVQTADGSNSSYWGENIARISSNGSNALLGPFVSIASGSNTSFSVASNTLTIHAHDTFGTHSHPEYPTFD